MRDIYGLRYVIVERNEPRAMACFDKHLITPFRADQLRLADAGLRSAPTRSGDR